MSPTTLDTPTLALTIASHAEHSPESPALTFLKNGDAGNVTTITWIQLDLRARTIAADLQQRGPAGSRAIVACPAGAEYAVAFVACLYAGWIPVPAPAPASARRDYRLAAIAQDAGALIALTTADGLLVARESSPALDWVSVSDMHGNPALWSAPAASLDDVAFLQYTSGSTSEPKGVVVTHRALAAQLACLFEAAPVAPGETIVSWMPLYHDYGLVGNLLHGLQTGAHIVLMPPASFLRRPAAWLETVAHYRAVLTGGPNFALDLCVRRITDAERSRLDLSSLRTLGCGGEPVHAETLRRFQTSFSASGLAHGVLAPAYGMAETVLMVTGPSTASRASHSTTLVVADTELVSCGAPSVGVDLRIVDPETREECRGHEIGEVWLRGATVTAGYWQRPQESLETFGALLADGSGPWLRTGDLGALVDGALYISGRRKEVIIVRGHNHYPTDIERTAQSADASLEPGAGAAFGVTVNGEERVVLVQEVARHARRTADLVRITAVTRDALVRTHGIPVHEVVIVEPLTVPKTSSGKVQRLACREAWLAGTLRVAIASEVNVALMERAA